MTVQDRYSAFNRALLKQAEAVEKQRREKARRKREEQERQMMREQRILEERRLASERAEEQRLERARKRLLEREEREQQRSLLERETAKKKEEERTQFMAIYDRFYKLRQLAGEKGTVNTFVQLKEKMAFPFNNFAYTAEEARMMILLSHDLENIKSMCLCGLWPFKPSVVDQVAMMLPSNEL